MLIAPPPQQPFLLFFDIPPGGHFASYRCTIQASATESEPPLVVDVSASQARDTVQLFVPASRLRPGPHELVIIGRNEREAEGLQPEAQSPKPKAGRESAVIARYPFILQGP